MHVLIAPEAITAMLSAADTAAALAEAWEEGGHHVRTLPMADGATGLIDAVAAARGGTAHPIPLTGPATVAEMQLVSGTAYVELGRALAAPVGVQQKGDLPGTTAPVAEVLLAAIAAGATRVVVGLGRSGVHDGGRGLLVRLATAFGVAAEPSTSTLDALRGELAHLRIEVAATTDLPLLGLHGAGAELAGDSGMDATIAQRIENQVGALVAQWERADAASVRRNLLTGDAPRPSRAPHSGAGGGAGFALALLGAQLRPGPQLVAEEVDLARAVADADLVITATPTLDGDAMHDGVPAVVGQTAMEVGIPVVAVGWEVHTSRRDGARVGISATYPARDVRMPGSQAPPSTDPLADLRARGRRIAKTWAQ